MRGLRPLAACGAALLPAVALANEPGHSQGPSEPIFLAQVALLIFVGRLLLPITGTETLRRVAEIAVALARASQAEVTALYVARTAPAARRARSPKSGTQRHEGAIMKDFIELAHRYETHARTAVDADETPQDAILR